VVQQIKAAGCLAGVALNPHTPVGVLDEILRDLDLVLIMSVNPGFGGQKFIEHTYRKVSNLKALIRATGSRALIEVDGGVNLGNAAALRQAGADVLVAGNFIFSASDPLQTIADLKNIAS
jgi:ribulose-phosphate 3-epimerase